MGAAVAAETNSSPASTPTSTALLSTPLQQRWTATPATAIKTSTCGPERRRRRGAGCFFVLSTSPPQLRPVPAQRSGRSEGAGFLSGFISCEQGAISQRGRERNGGNSVTRRHTQYTMCHCILSLRSLFLINPYPYLLYRRLPVAQEADGQRETTNTSLLRSSLL